MAKIDPKKHDIINVDNLARFIQDIFYERVLLLSPVQEDVRDYGKSEDGNEKIHAAIHEFAHNLFSQGIMAAGPEKGICSFFFLAFQMGRQFRDLEKKEINEVDTLFNLFKKDSPK